MQDLDTECGIAACIPNIAGDDHVHPKPHDGTMHSYNDRDGAALGRRNSVLKCGDVSSKILRCAGWIHFWVSRRIPELSVRDYSYEVPSVGQPRT